MLKNVTLLLILISISINCVICSIDSDIHIDGLFPPDIDHDWRFNWNAFPNKLPLSSKYVQLDPPKFTSTNKIEQPERKTFMDFASILPIPIPNAEALMAASGVSLLQNVASASIPNIPKMVSSFFNIRNMFNNRNQLLPLLRSREYRVMPEKGENNFGQRELPRVRRNVTRRFKRPIVVAPLDQNTLESDMSEVKINTTEKFEKEIQLKVNKENNSIERHTFVNSDFVGIPSPVGYNANVLKTAPKSNITKPLPLKTPAKSRFILKNPLETTVRSSYRSGGKNIFKSPPVMEEKFFTTSLKDLFQFQSNKEDDSQKGGKILIITDDDLNDSKRPRMMRQRSRTPKPPPRAAPAQENRKPPMELPVYIQEQRQMTGMHPPPIQIPNIFMGDEENEPGKKNDISESKICEQQKPKKMPTKPTKNPVHSSVMDIITNHSPQPPIMNTHDEWSYSLPITQKEQKSTTTQRPSPAISTMEIYHEFDNWSPGGHNNDEWSPNTPPFKPLHPHFQSDMNIIRNPVDYDDHDDDDLELPAESKKVVRLMMPEIKFPNQKLSATIPQPQQQFQLQSQQFQKKVNPYVGYPGSTSNIEQHRYPSPHMMLNDGLLYQRYNLLKEIEQMQANLFGGNNDPMDAMMGSNPIMPPNNQMMPNPIIASPLIQSPIQSPVVNSGPVVFSENPNPPAPSMKSGSFSQKGKPMKLMKFRVL